MANTVGAAEWCGQAIDGPARTGTVRLMVEGNPWKGRKESMAQIHAEPDHDAA